MQINCRVTEGNQFNKWRVKRDHSSVTKCSVFSLSLTDSALRQAVEILRLTGIVCYSLKKCKNRTEPLRVLKTDMGSHLTHSPGQSWQNCRTLIWCTARDKETKRPTSDMKYESVWRARSYCCSSIWTNDHRTQFHQGPYEQKLMFYRYIKDVNNGDRHP